MEQKLQRILQQYKCTKEAEDYIYISGDNAAEQLLSQYEKVKEGGIICGVGNKDVVAKYLEDVNFIDNDLWWVCTKERVQHHQKSLGVRQGEWSGGWKAIKKPRSHMKSLEKILGILGDPKIDIFIDLGPSEIGSEAWDIKGLYPDCLIVGIEASTPRYEVLKESNYPGILTHGMASDKDGEGEGFMGHRQGRSDFWSHGGDIDEGAFIKSKINSYTIDKLEEMYGPFEGNVFIWADIEGAELDAFKGAEKLLASGNVIALWVEVRRNPMSPGSCSRDEIVEFLEARRFESWPGNNPLIPPRVMDDYLFYPNRG